MPWPLSHIRTPSNSVKGLNSPDTFSAMGTAGATKWPAFWIDWACCWRMPWFSTCRRISASVYVARKKIATVPVAKARRPVRLARNRLIAASTTAHISPTSSPGMNSLVCAQTAAPPCALTIVPR